MSDVQALPKDENLPVERSVGARETDWSRWVLQTARRWQDMEDTLLSTGIEVIDHDHRRITEIALQIKNLMDLLQNGCLELSMVTEQERVLRSLYIGIAGHFEREERILQRYRLLGYAAHKGAHDGFLEQLRGYLNDFREGRLTGAVNLKTTILTWWLQHINEDDQRAFCGRNWTQDVIRVAKVWDDIDPLIWRTHVEALDEEHREIAELIFEIAHEAEASNDVNRRQSLLRNLQRRVRAHLDVEKAFMENHELSPLPSSVDFEGDFMAQINELLEMGLLNGRINADDLRLALLGGWIRHINEVNVPDFGFRAWGGDLVARMSHWTDIEDYVFETGMPDWDMDHRAFLDCLCDLNPLFEENDLILADQPAAADVSSILQRARDLAHRHFQDQEATLNQAELREGQLHVDEHTYFLDVVDRALTDFKVGRMAMTPALRNRLALWWINHINDTDASSLEELVELSAVTPNKAKRQLLTVTVPTEAEPVAVIQKKIRMTLTWDQ